MTNQIKIDFGKLSKLREVNPKLTSYNIEMTEVTGGTFWKPYTKEQIEGLEEFKADDMSGLTQMYEPVDLYDERLRTLAKGLGEVWVRVSGTWATKTYYDFDDKTNGIAPNGFENILTKEQWTGLLDFVKDINAKLLVSVSNCEGIHLANEPWNPQQAKLLFDYSIDYGVPIDAVEFMNEPNMINLSGGPKGYTVQDYSRDQDIFFRWVRENYKDVLLVGPCTTTELGVHPIFDDVSKKLGTVSTESILKSCKEPCDVFSYHYYNGVSERGAAIGGHWPVEKSMTDEYLSVSKAFAKYYGNLRDKYAPNTEMWVTESGDAGCGGNTWGSTFIDVFRTAKELGDFSELTDGVIFHNTFTSSDYGWIDHVTHLPRPNYWFIYLWNKLMGSSVYSTSIEPKENIHIYARNRKDGKDGFVYMIINNSNNNFINIEIPANADRYTLSSDKLRSRDIKLNGSLLEMKEDGTLPDINSKIEKAGIIEIAPLTITFLVF